MAKIHKDGSKWEIQFGSVDEGAKMPPIINAINAGRERKSLLDRAKETLVTEPIKTIFAILAGIAIAFLVWYFRLSP